MIPTTLGSAAAPGALSRGALGTGMGARVVAPRRSIEGSGRRALDGLPLGRSRPEAWFT
jgi:hypothetical protein